MIRWPGLLCLGLCAALLGCDDANSAAIDASAPAAGQSTPAAANPVADSTDPESANPAADAAAARKVELTPKNTKIEFVGNHTGDDPKPRHGSFQLFKGVAEVNETLKSVTVEIETASLTTEIDKLTNHLKNADFFDVNQFPTATFQSTAIADKGDGAVKITGDLTLLGNTQSVTFPAQVSTEGSLTLSAKFEIDRTRWGMNYGLDSVEKQVPISITIGG